MGYFVHESVVSERFLKLNNSFRGFIGRGKVLTHGRYGFPIIVRMTAYTEDVLVAQSCPTFATPWTVAHQAPLSMEFSRQEYWIGLPFPSPGDRPNLGIEPGSLTLQTDSLPSEPPGKPIC